MVATTKYLINIGRHGDVPKDDNGSSLDWLKDGEVGILYTAGAEFLEVLTELGITPEQASILWSGRNRTKTTAQARLAGAFNFQPTKGNTPPHEQDDLKLYSDLTEILTRKEQNINFGDPSFNMAVYRGDVSYKGVTRTAGCIKFWQDHPEATMHEDVPIEPFVRLYARVRQAIATHIRTILDSDDRGYHEVVSHAGVAEPIVMALVEAGKKRYQTPLDDMGGAFAVRDYGTLEIVKSGESLGATYRRNNTEHKVDLQQLMAA
jgi:hypothetical protein